MIEQLAHTLEHKDDYQASGQRGRETDMPCLSPATRFRLGFPALCYYTTAVLCALSCTTAVNCCVLLWGTDTPAPFCTNIRAGIFLNIRFPLSRWLQMAASSTEARPLYHLASALVHQLFCVFFLLRSCSGCCLSSNTLVAAVVASHHVQEHKNGVGALSKIRSLLPTWGGYC